MSVDQYRVALQGAGAAGQKAFAQLNQAITNAQMPIRTTHTMIDSLWMTMKNTMRWQLTSSMLMGFTSAVRKAYGYAQDLNESLNNIRIVTG
jgi:trimethylamine:corrinoid methyltransferase-like protein